MKPMSHSTYLRLQFLRQIFWDVNEKLKVLATLTFSDLAAFVPELLSQVSTTNGLYFSSISGAACSYMCQMISKDERCFAESMVLIRKCLVCFFVSCIHLLDFRNHFLFWHMQLHIEGLCHGNLSGEEAINISKIFQNTLSGQTLSVEARHGERVFCIPHGANFIRSVRVKNDLEENSVVEVGYVPVPCFIRCCLNYNLSWREFY